MKKGTSTVDGPKRSKAVKPNVIIIGDSVRVWSEVGVTVAVSDDPPQFLRFTFGHERIAKNSTQEEIRKTARLVDEFNEFELDRRVSKYKRLILREVAIGDGAEVDKDEEAAIAKRRKRIAKKKKEKAK